MKGLDGFYHTGNEELLKSFKQDNNMIRIVFLDNTSRTDMEDRFE